MGHVVIDRRELDTSDWAEEPDRHADASELDHVLSTVLPGDPRYAHVKASDVGPMRIVQLETSPRRFERTPGLIIRDRQDGLNIQLVLAGTAEGEAAGRAFSGVAGAIVILDLAQPFCVVHRESSDLIMISVPRDTLAPHVDDVRRLHGRVLDPVAAGLLSAHLRELAPRLTKLPDYAAPMLFDVFVRLLLLALGIDPASPAVPVSRRAALLERTRVLIDARLGSEDLTPEWLISRLNVSRSELYAALEEAGGIARLIRQRRLDGARAALANPHDRRRIGEIAFAFGFSSEAHFARAFRAAFGATAGDIRRATPAASSG